MTPRIRPRVVVPIVVLLAVSAGAIYALTIRLAGNGKLTVSGTVEAEEVRIAPELAGRVAAVLVEEGQTVAQGESLLQLDDSLLQAQRARVVASLAAAEQAVVAADLGAQAAAVQQEMIEAGARAQDAARQHRSWQLEAAAGVNLPSWYLTQDESLAAAEGEIEAAQASRSRAQDRLETLLADPAHAEIRQAELRLRRAQAAFLAADAAYQRALAARDTRDLYGRAEEDRTSADDELSAAQDAFDDLLEETTSDEVRQARADLAVAEARLTAALTQRDSLLTGLRSLDVQLGALRLQQVRVAADQAKAAVEQARAELEAVDVQLERMTLRAPVAGTVLTRSTDPGEVLPAGAAALTLGVLDNLTITVYLAEDRYGQIGLGDSVNVTVDSFPGEVFRGRVTRIADQAEFTPRNVQTEEGRRTTVFAVEIAIDDPSLRLKPGMPADVEFPGIR